MNDLNKLREEFETLLNIHELMEKSSAEYIGSDIYFTEDDYAFGYLNGAWCYYQEQQKTIDALRAQLEKLESGDYVLVPKEPTDETVKSGHETLVGAYEMGLSNGECIKHVYKAMIAAAQEQNDD